MSDATRPADVFAHDLRVALEAWRGAPWLPVISVLLGASVWGIGAERLLVEQPDGTVAQPDPVLVILLLVISLLELGWYGTEREVYRRVWTGDPDPGRDLLRTTLGYVGRFLRLGLLVYWPILLLGAIEDVAVAATAGFVLALVVNVVLTWATSVLAYRTAKATAALTEGLRLLLEHLVALRWHVLIPALLVGTLGAAGGAPDVPEPARFVIGALTTLAGVALKGALAWRWLALAGTAPRPAAIGVDYRG